MRVYLATTVSMSRGGCLTLCSECYLLKLKRKYLKLIFLVFFDYFDIKKKFKNKKKYYFNIFLIKKHFKKQLPLQCQTRSMYLILCCVVLYSYIK